MDTSMNILWALNRLSLTKCWITESVENHQPCVHEVGLRLLNANLLYISNVRGCLVTSYAFTWLSV